MKLQQQLLDIFLSTPESQMDPSLKEDIKGWDSNPSALDILHILDKIVAFSLASEFMLGIFEMLLQQAVEAEDTTIEALTRMRTWDLSSLEKEKENILNDSPNKKKSK